METTHFVRCPKKFTWRKRATKACLGCRRRKVRCDVTRTSHACTNCRLDGHGPLPHNHGSPASFRLHVPNDALNNNDRTAVSDLETPSLPMNNDIWPNSTDSPTLGTNEAERQHRESGQQCDGESASHDIEMLLLLDTAYDEQTQKDAPQSISQAPLQSKPKALYSSLPFLKALNIRDSDLGYLKSRGCLDIPAKPILDEFVRHYFLYIHPMLPLLNEADFWDSYDTTYVAAGSAGSGSRASLLLLQAMMFASSTFVANESLHILGFTSVAEAKESFYTKAKLLYDFATDSDPISIAQAALLLTYWCPTFRPEPRKSNSRWLSIAVQHAKICNADKYATFAQGRHVTPQEQKRQNILKRVWWCCIIRDRIMPLCVRRNIQITRQVFDFDLNSPLGYDDLVDELDFSRVYNTATKHSLLIALERLTTRQ